MKIITRIRDFLYSAFSYILLLAICAVLGAVVWFSYRDLLKAGSEGVPIQADWNENDAVHEEALSMEVVIPEDLNAKELTKLLTDYKVLDEKSAPAFQSAAEKAAAGKVIPGGTFTLTDKMTPEEILKTIGLTK